MAQDVVSAVDGTVKKVDAASKVVVVKTADGTEHTFHYADDLATLSAHLDLKNAVHVGHSSGGGEVAHYLARHGESRVAKVALIRCGATADGEDRCQPERFAKEGPRRLPVGARRQALS